MENLFDKSDVTCQKQTTVSICHLPQINFSVILEENRIFLPANLYSGKNYSEG